MLHRPSSQDSLVQTSQQALHEMLLQKQMVLAERIADAQQTLRSTEGELSRLQANESKIVELKAENDVLRERLEALEKNNKASAEQAERLRKEILQLKKMAAVEIGNAVKALLPYVRFSILKQPSLAEKAAFLVDKGIIDPNWYMGQFEDVPSGMDAGAHYVLYGADEGRAPKQGLL